jgi:hypothetical protein
VDLLGPLVRTALAPRLTTEDAHSHVLGVKWVLRLGDPRRAPGCHRVTAVLTATSSTVSLSHSNTIRRTPHAHVTRSDQGPACIC